ncbi:MAG: hypothetical protein ACM3JI_00415, partial [Anaerolineae bacterium]
ERKVYYDRLSKRDYQLAMGSWSADVNDPLNFLEIFKYKEASTNSTGWENPIYTKLLDDAINACHLKERLDLLKTSEELLMEEMPIIPLFHVTFLYLKKETLKDIVLSSLGHLDVRWASMSSDERALDLRGLNEADKKGVLR